MISKGQKIITLGPEFSYSHSLVIKKYSESKVELVNTISEVFDKVDKSKKGVVPIENVLNGSVRETFLNLQQKRITIQKAFDYKIEHILAGQDKKFTTIISHPQALIQCSDFLQTMRQKGVEVKETTSTSRAMQIAQEDKNIAAIGNQEAAQFYDLQILKRQISNQNNNTTRFIEINKGKINTSGQITSLIISPETDRSGLLFEILAVFKIKELNLTKIESIVTGKKMNHYMFYLDIESSLEHSRMQEAIEFLQTFVKVDILGSYDIYS